MYEFVEPRLRHLVAEHLGVGLEELASQVSLRDDLAADSLDLVELSLALEAEFAIVVPERILDRVRTYGDLVHATGLLIRTRCEAEARGAERPPRMWVRITPPAGESGGTLERTGWLTPYTAETIAEDAVRAGSGAHLEVTLAASTTASLAQVQHQFARLWKRGVQVTVRRDDLPAPATVHSTPDRAAERYQVAAASAHPALTDRLLDQLTGARTTVTVTGYVGDDPWQADDLIACVGQSAKRFGDGTPAEQTQALNGRGPFQFVEGNPPGCGYRATTEGHHVHTQFDRPSGWVGGPTGNLTEKEPTRLEIGLGFAKNARYYRSGLCTAIGLKGELLTWREAVYYSQDREERAFDIGSSMSQITPTGHSSGRQQGLRARFDMSARSPNGFRPLSATLDWAADDGVCSLVIDVSARVAGKDLFGQVTLGGGVGPTMDVRFLPPTPALEVDGVASP